ncbi:hypothetical protein [Pseudoroseomonas ludipueritiae]|uniref:Uncharacterized protein n=1 Tax=Pseudoroseomonas ludipueritiae TaxID=198093 RepID=A0ABR7R4U1_9PROT|nr:hypothetical protein [Pseudoroseomonas ludipueritiae]MBC9176751.1 hypothetical protein [Pseudoroseomonas ludipueritiae]
MQYVLARLREPGTMRSLAVVLFALLGLAPDDPRMELAIQMGILALGAISALIPEKSTQAAETVQQAAATAQVAATTAASAVKQVANTTSEAAQLVNSARSLAEAVNVTRLRNPEDRP